MHKKNSDIDAYREFCSRTDVPLFARDYWLDSVCPGHWNVVVVRKNGRVVAAMPYHEVRKFGLAFLIQPRLTQFLGPQIDYSGVSPDEYSRRLFFRECVEEILSELKKKKFAYQQIAMHRSYTDWLPFYWSGYRSILRYSYVVDNTDSCGSVSVRFSKSRRRDIRSAKLHGVTVDTGMSVQEFYDFHSVCVAGKGEKLSYPKQTLLDLYKTLSERDEAVVFAARNSSGEPLSAGLVVMDSHSAYLLMTANDRKCGTDGAFGCMIEYAMEYCSSKVKLFDFEGSMIKGAEQSYSKYGTLQKPYICVEKYSSFFMEILLRISGKVK